MKQTHTAYAVVYKKNSSDYDGEAKKGTVDSLHLFLKSARYHQDKDKHIVKKITFEL